MLMLIAMLAMSPAGAMQAAPPPRPEMNRPGHPDGAGRGGPGMGGRGPMGRGFDLDRMFAIADTDRNGQLSKAEVRSAMETMRERHMQRREGRDDRGRPGGMQRPPIQR